jgi:hypothetical protein
VFFVTAQLVKPVNPDDLPQLRGVDGLKNGSPLGIEPKGEGITGRSGFSTGTSENKPAATPQPSDAKPAVAKPAGPAETKAISQVMPINLDDMPAPPPMPAAQAKLGATVAP